MRRAAHLLMIGVVALTVFAPSAPTALAADKDAPLRKRISEAVTALDAGDAERAVTVLQELAETSDAAVADPTLQYDLGVAFSRADRADEARAAYRAALAAPGRDAHAEKVRGAALYNLGTSHLHEAHGAAELLRDPERLAASLAGSAAPGGGPMSPEGQADLLRGIRAQTARTGLSHARDAISALRDRVRAMPADRDAAHNLQLAQRVRRFLEEEIEKQQESEPEDSGKENDENDDQDNDENSEQNNKENQEQSDQENSEQSGDDGSQDSPSAGEQGEQDPSEGDQEQESGEQDGESGSDEGQEKGDESDDEHPPEEQGAAGKSDDKKDEPLADMLEAAARRMRLVEEMRRSKMRKVKVEKDW